MSEKILAVIPAREGSKGIPRKNLRELGGIPLVAHAIKTCAKSDQIDTTILTTDSEEISQIGQGFGVDTIINRPDRLSTDEVPLAPVVEHAYRSLGEEYDYILCFQPTTPLLSYDSVDNGIKNAITKQANSVVFVRDQTHLYWKKHDEGFTPVVKNRENRQELNPIYEEIGIFLTHQNLVKNGKRVGQNPEFHIVNRKEGTDIDTYSDWLVAESHFNRKQLVYRLTGSEQTGTGHAYRGITIADHLFEHNLTFVTGSEDEFAIKLIEESNYPYEIIDEEAQFIDFVLENNIDVVVNDILDTTENYIQSLRSQDIRVVNFEDLGSGRYIADATINSLYEHSKPPQNHYYGFEFFCLRNEFRHANTIPEIDSVNRIMISFGGTDQNNLTARTIQACGEIDDNLMLDVVLGPGYTKSETLDPIIDELDQHEITVQRDISSMASHMEAADMLITSNGRTLYEAAALNLPMLSISQNEREQKHPYAHISHGIRSLGNAAYISKKDISDAILEYLERPEMRESMREALSNHDIANGVNRVKQIIVNEDNDY